MNCQLLPLIISLLSVVVLFVFNVLAILNRLQLMYIQILVVYGMMYSIFTLISICASLYYIRMYMISSTSFVTQMLITGMILSCKCVVITYFTANAYICQQPTTVLGILIYHVTIVSVVMLINIGVLLHTVTVTNLEHTKLQCELYASDPGDGYQTL